MVDRYEIVYGKGRVTVSLAKEVDWAKVTNLEVAQLLVARQEAIIEALENSEGKRLSIDINYCPGCLQQRGISGCNGCIVKSNLGEVCMQFAPVQQFLSHVGLGRRIEALESARDVLALAKKILQAEKGDEDLCLARAP